MGMTAMAKKIKEVHPNYLILYKSGAFYKSLGKDAYLLSSIFDYNIKFIEENIATCGFPLNSIIKVRSKLEEKNINYMLIDQRNNYDIDISEDFRNLNKYEDEFKKAYTKVKHKKMISRIVEELMLIIDKPYFKDTIRKVEDIIDENGEI